MRGKKEKIYSEFLQVSNKTGVPINKVRDMFWYLSRGKAIENNRLLQMVGVSKNALNQVKNALSSYLESATRETKLQGGIAEKIQRLYGSNYATEEMLLKVIEGNIYRNSIELLAKYRERRPTPKREYDQFTATVETTARRVSLLNFFADVKGKRMVFLGDDDFTSIATANLRTAQNVTVVDIDSRILDEIEKISRDNNLGIKLLKYDATKLFPNQLKGQFDMVLQILLIHLQE